MDKKDLMRRYIESEKKFEAAKTKRAIKTILFFAVLYFLLLVNILQVHGMEILGVFLASLFLGGVHLLINSAVFYHLFSASESEKKYLDEMKKQLDAMK